MENSTIKNLNPAEAKELLKQYIADKNRDGLWIWIKEFLGWGVPRVSICQNHCAPFDFISDYLFGEIKDAIVLANRSGGKTLDFGILDTIMAFISDDTEIAAVGAIKFQADKGYQYFNDFSSKFPFVSNIHRLTRTKTDCLNGSSVQVLTGTMSGVNSPHPQILFLDEIDLMAWQVLQQALSMPQSKHGVESRTVLTSTRKFGSGPMQRLIDEADERGYKVYQWCIWEVVEPLPEDPEKMEDIRKEFDVLPEKINQAEGYYTWIDTISKHKSLDQETWEVEWLCSKPGMQGVIYGSSYSDEDNLLANWSPEGKRGYIYIAEDFGYGEGHPDAVLFCWLPPEYDRMIVFDELYMTNYSTDAIWKEIENTLLTYKMTVKGNVRGWACDYHGLTEIVDRKQRGAPILDKHPDASLYLVDNGINIVKKFLQTGRLMITDKCPTFRSELMSYKRKKNLDGTFSRMILKTNDHGPDGIRYLLVRIGEQIGRNAFVLPNQEEVVKSDDTRQEYERISPPTPFSGQDPDRPITADLVGMKW